MGPLLSYHPFPRDLVGEMPGSPFWSEGVGRGWQRRDNRECGILWGPHIKFVMIFCQQLFVTDPPFLGWISYFVCLVGQKA